MGYLNKYKLIHESQSGFRQKHSCQTALVKLIDHWTACIDKGDIIGTLFVDFRKAYDVVDHSILIKKLHLYKFSPNAVRWFQSYRQLSSASYSVRYRSHRLCQDPLRSSSRVYSRPNPFLLFINDLPLFLTYCNSDFYAHDATFHTNGKDKLNIENNLQSDLGEAKQWSKCNKMYINYQKTSCMTLGTKHRLNGSNQLDINADNIKIKQVSDQKLLGLHINENLNRCSHIDHLCKTVSSKISLLRQLSEYVPAHVQRLFYQGYTLPLLDYGSVIWDSSSTANIERLTNLQKRAARIILNAKFDTPSSRMFQKLDWLPMGSRIKYNKAVLTYKALNNMTPEYITKLLTPKSQTHSLNLRSGENGTLYVPLSRTTVYSGAFSCSVPRLWNSLPYAIRNSESLNAFKKSIKPLC